MRRSMTQGVKAGGALLILTLSDLLVEFGFLSSPINSAGVKALIHQRTFLPQTQKKYSSKESNI